MQRRYLLSTCALVSALAAQPGHAFDQIKWNWTLDADSNIHVDVDVDIKVDPTGVAIVEVDQVYHGRLDSVATIDWVVNEPGPGASRYGPDDLPAVENTAAAIGNVSTIESQVAVLADVNQSTDAGGFILCGPYGGGCSYHSIPTEFTAMASVHGVSNASVDNTAQVVGNSSSITVDPRTNSDGVVIANVAQFANLDATAHAHVSGVEVSGYSGLGLEELDRPLVSNTAVAVGNVSTITVLTGSLAE